MADYAHERVAAKEISGKQLTGMLAALIAQKGPNLGAMYGLESARGKFPGPLPATRTLRDSKDISNTMNLNVTYDSGTATKSSLASYDSNRRSTTSTGYSGIENLISTNFSANYMNSSSGYMGNDNQSPYMSGGTEIKY
jgi:hypothetical protein